MKIIAVGMNYAAHNKEESDFIKIVGSDNSNE